ncbi:DUF3040 domain-containing protein [Streptomyces sp. V2]|uniref:DUF3040 domain-containing protein n=1 Tax=Streptomyces niveiscabiei TaxID=164115 RepID=A0ABW9HJB1_9ACTN|nr:MULTISPECIES: DUF3040 domain-containing protein [Streptomyces]PWG09356.1 DUF3040 domain-containing protein [Streptomyces sp. V2]QZZ32120.1 DUF3040 domain-containing protein [Streptomyces sp. ST1015]
MSDGHDDRLEALASATERDDARFARALAEGHPERPREYRRGRAWWALGTAGALLFTGIALPHGLVLATGLVVAGMAATLFDPHRRHPGSRRR